MYSFFRYLFGVDLLSCMMQGILRGFTMPEEQPMEDVTYKAGPKYYGRIIFDLTFFIILGVLLFNMVTGIIVGEFIESCEL